MTKIEWQKKTLVIIRGLPGSGKSTKADKICDELRLSHHKTIVEADHYRRVNGEYVYDRRLNALAAAWTQAEAFRRLQTLDTVIVTGTFSRYEYVHPYIETCRDLGLVDFLVIKPDTPWQDDPKTCFQKCCHGVPLEKIESMAKDMNSWVLDIDIVRESIYNPQALTIDKWNSLCIMRKQ